MPTAVQRFPVATDPDARVTRSPRTGPGRFDLPGAVTVTDGVHTTCVARTSDVAQLFGVVPDLSGVGSIRSSGNSGIGPRDAERREAGRTDG